MNRRHFLGTAGTALISCANAQSTYEWGNPVLDIHVHPRLGPGMPNIAGGELAHINGGGVTKAILLTRADMAEHSKGVVAQNPDRFVWSVSTDVNRPDAIEILRRNLTAGAIALGETSAGGRGCDSLVIRTWVARMAIPSRSDTPVPDF